MASGAPAPPLPGWLGDPPEASADLAEGPEASWQQLCPTAAAFPPTLLQRRSQRGRQTPGGNTPAPLARQLSGVARVASTVCSFLLLLLPPFPVLAIKPCPATVAVLISPAGHTQHRDGLGGAEGSSPSQGGGFFSKCSMTDGRGAISCFFWGGGHCHMEGGRPPGVANIVHRQLHPTRSCSSRHHSIPNVAAEFHEAGLHQQPDFPSLSWWHQPGSGPFALLLFSPCRDPAYPQRLPSAEIH